MGCTSGYSNDIQLSFSLDGFRRYFCCFRWRKTGDKGTAVTATDDEDVTNDDWHTTSPYGLNQFDMHQIMKENFGCDVEICLDGGSSTAIAYMWDGSREVKAVTNNPVKTMVTVPSSTF